MSKSYDGKVYLKLEDLNNLTKLLINTGSNPKAFSTLQSKLLSFVIFTSQYILLFSNISLPVVTESS